MSAIKAVCAQKRCLQQVLKFDEFIAHVKHIEHIEKYIATKNDKLSKHNRKWFIRGNNTEYDNINGYVLEYLQSL